MWNIQESLFLVLEFPALCKGSNTFLWNIQGLSFVLPGISWGKVKNEKFQVGFQKKYILNPGIWIFSGIAH